MPTVEVYNVKGEQVGEIELSDAIFAAEVNESLLFDVSQMLLAAAAAAPPVPRTAVSTGGGRKPWRQKGTGRARHGSIRSPIWTGGGIIFGPKPRQYRYRLPKKVRRAALYSALTSKLSEKKLLVLDALTLSEPRTRDIVSMLGNLKVKGSVLLVTAGPDINVFKSARNIPGVTTTIAAGINVLDILKHETLLLTRDAVAKIEEVFANEKSA